MSQRLPQNATSAPSVKIQKVSSDSNSNSQLPSWSSCYSLWDQLLQPVVKFRYEKFMGDNLEIVWDDNVDVDLDDDILRPDQAHTERWLGRDVLRHVDKTFPGVGYLHLRMMVMRYLLDNCDDSECILHRNTLIGLLTARFEVTWSLRFVEPWTSTSNLVFAVLDRLTRTWG